MACEHEEHHDCLPNYTHMMDFIVPWMQKQTKQRTMKQAVRSYLKKFPERAPGVITEMIGGMLQHDVKDSIVQARIAQMIAEGSCACMLSMHTISIDKEGKAEKEDVAIFLVRGKWIAIVEAELSKRATRESLEEDVGWN